MNGCQHDLPCNVGCQDSIDHERQAALGEYIEAHPPEAWEKATTYIDAARKALA